MNNINTAFAAKVYAAPAISVTEVEIEGVVLTGSPEVGASNEGYIGGGSYDF